MGHCRAFYNQKNHVIREIFINNQTMSVVARAKNLSLDRIWQIKEKGLWRLRIGKAKKELKQKFDIMESKLYRGTLKNFRQHDSSIVEYLAVKKADVEECYQKHLREIEEM